MKEQADGVGDVGGGECAEAEDDPRAWFRVAVRSPDGGDEQVVVIGAGRDLLFWACVRGNEREVEAGVRR